MYLKNHIYLQIYVGLFNCLYDILKSIALKDKWDQTYDHVLMHPNMLISEVTQHLADTCICLDLGMAQSKNHVEDACINKLKTYLGGISRTLLYLRSLLTNLPSFKN